MVRNDELHQRNGFINNVFRYIDAQAHLLLRDDIACLQTALSKSSAMRRRQLFNYLKSVFMASLRVLGVRITNVHDNFQFVLKERKFSPAKDWS